MALHHTAFAPHTLELFSRIEARTARIGIVGLGYVGLPLVIEFHRHGYPVVGFDIDDKKVQSLLAGRTYIGHIAAADIAALNTTRRFEPTTNYARAADCDALLLCVPTPLTRHREPDMTYVEGTCAALAPHVRRGQLIVLESTTYPGTTEEIMVPVLEGESGLRAGHDFHIAYSPEREDPGNRTHKTATIPKVVGGLSPACLEVANALYSSIVEQTVPVSSVRVAEATKLVENIFRCVNIAMVNELKVVFERMGIDIWEVIEAAKTKPFGYMPFYPGPGLGGHCIPIDPFYLTWKAREFDMPTRFIELAGEINTQMPYYVVTKTVEALNAADRPIKGARLLLVGLAYKPDVDDMRESPTLKLIELYEKLGAHVEYHDPHIPAIKPNREHPTFAGRRSVDLAAAGDYHAVVICTAHRAVDFAALGHTARLIIDTRNAMAGIKATCPVYKA